jgi:hypothetical protein
MKFKFIISKWGNFYFFVQNLSEWHFSCNRNYNAFWQNTLGKLTKEEKESLEIFKKIRLNYKTSKSCFEEAFFIKRNPWQLLSSTLTSQEYQDIHNTFIILQNKFEKLYKKECPLLRKWQKLLDKTANNKTLNKKITKVLDKLYGTDATDKNIIINVYLLLSSPNATGGGANIDKKSITLEISRYLIEKSNHALGIIWHEIIHLLFQNKNFFPLVLKNTSGQKDADFINEITAAALFPRGLLSQQFFNNNLTNHLHPSLTPENTSMIFQLLKDYIHNYKTLNIYYINQIKNILAFSEL